MWFLFPMGLFWNTNWSWKVDFPFKFFFLNTKQTLIQFPRTLSNASFLGGAGASSFLSASFKILWAVESPIYSIFLYQSEQNRTNPSYNTLTTVSQSSTRLLWQTMIFPVHVCCSFPVPVSSAYVWPWRLGVGEKSLRALQFDIYSGLSKWVWNLFVNVKLAYLIDFNLIVSGYPAEEAQDTQTPQTFVY